VFVILFRVFFSFISDENLSASLRFILDKNKIMKHFIRMKIH